MAFATGTSTDYKDLLFDLKTIANSNGWDSSGTGSAEGRYTTGTEDELIATGNGGGSDAITMGIRTFTKAQQDVRGWELAGMDSYTDANTWENQPGISPGRHDGAGNAAYGSYLSLCNRTMTYWWSATSRRLCGVIRVGTVYQGFYLGWGAAFDSAANYPQPKVVAGSTYDPLLHYTDSDIHMTGPVNPIGSATSGRNGPCQLHNRAGSWVNVRNHDANDVNHVTSSPTTSSAVKRMFPCGRINVGGITGADAWISLTLTSPGSVVPLHMVNVIPSNSADSNWPGTQNAILRRTPDPTSAHDTVARLPAIIHDEAELDVELDGMGWCSAAGGPTNPPLQPEDRLQDPNTGAFFRVFPQGSHQAEWNYLWLKES
jgi:hypothetical protein